MNTLFNALLDAPGFDAGAHAQRGVLKLAVAGGMAVQRTVAERWQQAIGVPLIEGYGLTEASPIVCANPLDAQEFSGKHRPAAALDRGRRSATSAADELPPGEAGEICVRGPQVMRGYWNAPDETAAAFCAGRLAAHRRHRPDGRSAASSSSSSAART